MPKKEWQNDVVLLTPTQIFTFKAIQNAWKIVGTLGPCLLKGPCWGLTSAFCFPTQKEVIAIRITVCCAFASNSWIPALMSLPMPSSVARIPKVKSAYWNRALMSWWKESPTVTRIRSIHISHSQGCIVDCMMELSLTHCTCNRTKYNDQQWDNK